MKNNHAQDVLQQEEFPAQLAQALVNPNNLMKDLVRKKKGLLVVLGAMVQVKGFVEFVVDQGKNNNLPTL